MASKLLKSNFFNARLEILGIYGNLYRIF